MAHLKKFMELTNQLQVVNRLLKASEEKTPAEAEATEFLHRIQDATGIPLYGRNLQSIRASKVATAFMIFDRWERPYYISLWVTSGAVLYNIFILMLRFAFLELDSPASPYLTLWQCLDGLSDFVYICDMVVQARTGYLKQGILIQDARNLAFHYFKSPGFRFDLLSILPTEVFFYQELHTARNLASTRFNRLLRFPRLFEFLDRTWRITSRPIAVRTGTMVLYLLIIVHWNACFYYYASELIGFGTDQWVFNASAVPDFGGRYVRCVYWVAMTMTTGESLNPGPQTNTEIILTGFNVLLGILLFATIVGNIGSLVTAGLAKRTAFNSWYDRLCTHMKRHRIKPHVVHKVNKWVEHYLLEDTSGSDDALKPLPYRLQAEINMNVHLDTLRRVKIFQDCEPGLLVTLVNKLKLVMFNPKEYVCKIGDVGKEMYIVRSGLLSVLTAEEKIVGTLSAGAVFGELSLLNISGTKTGNRRTASVRSDGYTYTFCLTKEDLWAALDDHPDARRVFQEKGRQILIRDGLLQETNMAKGFALLSPSSKIETLCDNLDRLTNRMSTTMYGIRRFEHKLDKRIQFMERKIEKYAICQKQETMYR